MTIVVDLFSFTASLFASNHQEASVRQAFRLDWSSTILFSCAERLLSSAYMRASPDRI